MQKAEVHSFFKYFRYSLAVLLLNFCIVSVHAQLPYSESFKNATAADLIVSGVSGDAFLTAGSIDPAGQGYLRLTNNQNYQSGFVRSTTSFPSGNGLSISFDYFTHGGTGADGISFFLYDATASPFNIGTFGGSLGYAQSSDFPGLSKGFIALGLDEFGNFSNPNAGRQGGPGRIASSVVLRGDGNGLGAGTPSGSNYEFLTGISTNNTSAMAVAGAGGIFQVAGGVNGRTVTSGLTVLNTGYRRAKIDLVPNVLGLGFIVNVWITEGNSSGAIVHHVVKNYLYIPTGPIPANLSYGFSAGTGSASNFHEIRNLEIVKPIDRSTVPVIADLNLEGSENVTYSFSQSNFTSKFTQFSFGSLAKIKVLNLPLHGTLKLNGITVSAGQEINITDVVNLKFIPELDFIGITNFQWNGSDGSSYALSDAFVNLNILALTPTFPYSESFRNSTSTGLIISGTTNSAELTSGVNDPAAGGYLRLTKNQINQTGYVYNTKNFPSENGLAISFDYYSHGGTGSDGINFFLYDAAANPFTIGAFGGAMGYAQSYTSSGLGKGFIGLGLDDYGNFSSPGSGRQGGPGRAPGSVTLRGDGDGSSLLPSNFEYLKHIQTSNIADMSGAAGTFELSGNRDSRTAGIVGLGPLDSGYRRVKMELVPNGLRTGFIVNVWITEGNVSGPIVHHVIKDYSYISTEQIPANLRYGFSASTGAAGTFYEVRNLDILLPSNLNLKPVVTNISKTGYEDQSIVFQNSDFQNSFFDPQGFNTLKRIEFTSLPLSTEGVLKLNGNAITQGQAIDITDIIAGKFSFTPVPNFHGTVSSFKWKGSTSSNTALVPDHVLITLNPVNDSPAGTNKEILLAVNESDRILTESDFGFTDPTDGNLNAFMGVKIAGIPGSGTLKLNNINVVIGQLVPVEAISSGLLTFTPVNNEFGRPYTTFSFQVKDNGGVENGGADLDQSPNLLTIIVAPLPTVVLASANRSICAGTESVIINYNSVSGDPIPNIYNIDWDAAANTAGIVDISNKSLSDGVITIDGLLNIPAGNYQGILTVRNSSNLILSAGLPISVLIRPLLRANISYGVSPFCNFGKANVSFSGDSGGKYTSSAGLVLNELTGEIDLSTSAPGNYTVTYSLNNEVCSILATTPLKIIALPVIANITGAESLIAGSTSQLNSVTTGGVWRSTDKSIATVNSTGLVMGLKRGIVQIVYTVKNESCTDSVSFQINVSSLKAGDMVKIMNENKSILFSSIEFYNLIDLASRANDPMGNAIAKIRIESSPANGILKLNGIQINSGHEILYNDISGLTFTPNSNFSGTDIFKWNWADSSGQYGNHQAVVSISVVSSSSLFQYSVNENEGFRGQTATTGRSSFELSGVDAATVEINSSTGAITMNNRDYEIPEDSNSDNIYDFIISSKDGRGNSYSENFRIIVQNVREYAKLSIVHNANEEIAENLKYTSNSPGIIGRPIGKVIYSLAGTDSTLFKIDSLSGIVSMEGKDFESPIDSNKDNVYEAGIQVKDSDLNIAVVYWKVKVANVLEVSQITLVSVSDVTIEENKIYSSAAPVLNGKSIGNLNYTLTGNDSNLFKIDTASGIVSLEGKDFESASDSDMDNVYEVGVLAEDSDMNTAKVSWKVTVSDVKEVSSFSLVASGNVNIEENKIYSNAEPILSGKPIGKVIYSLTGQDSTFFKLDAITGILSMEGKDFESASDSDKDNVYEIGLKATDSDLNTVNQSWKVTVTNVREISSIKLALLGDVVILENQNYTSDVPVLIGKPIGKVIYSLTGQDSIFFKIDTTTGILSMQGKDFESASDLDKDNVYEIGIKATDSDLNTAVQSWKVTVTNVREVSSFSLALFSDATIEENKNYTSNVPVLIGKTIGKVMYSLTGQDSNFFKIDAITGILSMEGKDFESASDSDKDNVYEVGVKATDSDLNTANQSWKVTVTNLREVSSITLASLSDVTIEENKNYISNVPVLIGKPMGKVVYTLIGKDSIHFNINAISGIVSMEGKDYEAASDSDNDNVYEVGIQATDFDMNTTSISWKVGVSNVQELSSFDLAPFSDVYIEENTNFTSSAPVVIGKPFGKLIYKLTGKDATLFKIDSLTGIVSMEAKDFESASDSDKNNVYEVGLWASDSDLNTSGISWKINIVNVKELSSIKLASVSDVKIDEKKIYTSTVPVLDGNPVGKLTYSISGRDSIFFQVDKSKGIVSMQGRDFDSPQDFDKDNRYEICLIAKDSDGNRAIVEWKILVQLIRPSATHSMLSPEVNSILLNRNSSQILTLTTKYANGDRYKRGGEQVLINKVSGSGTISSVTDHGDGTYSAIVKPDTTAGSGIFVASIAGEEVRNGNNFQAKSTINYIPSTDAGLKSFTLSKGNLSPQFKSEISDYTTIVEYSVDSISFNLKVNEEHAKIVVNRVNVSSQNSAIKIPLSVGRNMVEVIVTAQDGIIKKIYNLLINRSEAVFPYRESFMTDTVRGLVFGGSANTARLTSGSFDVSGKGYLQLNRNRLNESGFVHNSQKFPSAKGLDISFEYYTHGGTGGDGLSFFLFDAKASFKIGAFGGSLGYAQNSSNAGLNKGFIGLGLDEYGEFSNTTSNKQGGPGRRASSAVIRGDGNGIGSGDPSRSNYEYLTGMQTRDASAMKLAGAGNIFFIPGMQDGRTAPGGSLDPEEIGYRKVKMQMFPNSSGSGFVINVWITEGSTGGPIVHHLIKNYAYIPTDGIPVDLKYGFSAGSETTTNYHEIRNLEITLPVADAISALPPVVTILPNDVEMKNSVTPLPTNLITPNGDGINDTWVVRNIDQFPNNKIRIFSSSGQEVYVKNNYNNEWDGKMAGIPLPLGTYYYIFERGNSASPYKGYITIHQ